MPAPDGRLVQVIINLPCPLGLVADISKAMERQYPGAFAKFEEDKLLLYSVDPDAPVGDEQQQQPEGNTPK